MSEKTVIIYKSLAVRIYEHISFFGSLTAVVSIGIWLKSEPLQWVGAILWIFAILVRAHGESNRNKYTLDEAAAKIDEWRKAERRDAPQE